MRYALLVLLLLCTPAFGQEVCDREASQFLTILHLTEHNHQVYKENLATLFFNLREPVPEEALGSVESLRSWLHQKEDLYREQRTVGSNELGRWTSKLENALLRPYTDSQAARHLDEVVAAFRNRCHKLAQAHPDYPRRYFATGGLVFGRFGAFSELDYFFNDQVSGSKPFVTSGLCRGVAYDELTFQQRVEHPLVASASYELTGPEPWQQVHQLVFTRLQERGLQIEKIPFGWKVVRAGYPARKHEDPTPEADRAKPL
ncbi:hypothetical protein ABS71_14790 [bacterium SCN 62-11]|nr:hypothetical protein [Candidatus Eremiobacteraeota bacterium]ODT63077.1 MAG: hypothetical protein ABS71_14790 [bacterium SCN 62-11]